MAAAWVYTLSVIIDNYWSKYSSYESVTHAYQNALQKKEAAFFSFLETGKPQLAAIAAEKHTAEDIKRIANQPFLLFLYYSSSEQQAPFFWSSNQVVPTPAMVKQAQSGTLYKYGNGHYEILRKTIDLNGVKVEAVGLILLHRQYFIDNARLQKGFPGFNSLEGRMLFSANPTPYLIRNVKGERLFFLQPAIGTPFKFFSWVSFLVQLVATLLLIFLVSRLASVFMRGSKPAKGLVFFIGGFLLLWVLIRQFGFPINPNQFSRLGNSDSLSPPPTALLNQLHNSLFVFWLGLFVTTQSQIIGQMLSGLQMRWRMVLSALIIFMGIAIHFAIIQNICDLYLSAAIAFDLNNFFSLNYTTILAFVIIFFAALAHLMLMRFIVRLLLFITGGNVRFVLLALLAGGLLTLSVAGFLIYKNQLLFSLLWLLVFAYFVSRFRHAALPVTSGRMVVWMLVYAFSISLLLGELSDQRLRKRMYEIGKTLLMQNDQTSDYLVRFASGGMRRFDWNAYIARATDSADARSIKDSLTAKYFGGYLDRFVTRFYFFNQQKNSVNNESPESYESLQTLFMAGTQIDGYPWLAFFEESFDRFGYIIRFDAREGGPEGNVTGHVFVVVQSVVLRNAVLAPELFRQLQDFAIDLPPGFSYAWYKDGRLVEQKRNYPFPSLMPTHEKNQQSIWEREVDGSFEVWMNAGANTSLAISSGRKIWIDFVSLMAYIFCSFLLLFFTVRVVAWLLQPVHLHTPFFKPLVLNIQAQIRLTIIGVLGISFCLVAFITINFFVGQFRKTNEERLAKTIEAASAGLLQQLPASGQLNATNVPQQIKSGALRNMGKSLDTDINFYDLSGKLSATTQPVLFVKQVVSELMNPEVYFVLTKGSVHRHLMHETIGNLEYTSIYQPFRLADGSLQGYLQIPYFASQNELKQEISNFVVILINIIAFIFLLSGGLAVWVSGSITKSFGVIAEKMNQLRLSEKNERIEWSANNEIGNLVSQYNRMVDELEASAGRLAQSERELAWREMARQVAHEIKNPLTPMKLSLQFLQKAIQEKHPDVTNISERVAGNLVVQIDHLSKIAFEFSQFANIGNAKSQVFDLHEVLQELILLYGMQHNLQLHWVRKDQAMFVNADKTQMNRLFTNLIQNATEAMENMDVMKISLIETIENGKLQIEIRDSGAGVPPDIQPRIFMPNFTTKSSGTGLGLAISKAIVEKAGGRIWFNTEAGKGTSFFVQLPLVG